MSNLNDSSALLLKTAIDSGITSPAELANIMGNASVETKHFSTMDEDLNYRTVKAVLGASSSADKRFTKEQIQSAVDSHDPKQVATVLYENRGKGDLGNTEPGDGWKYHGRGFFQYTGRYNYQTFGDKFGVDLVNNPDQAAEPKMAAKLAIAYWKDIVPENARLDARLSGEAINGGPNGADARITASEQWAKTITPELITDIQSGKITLEDLSKIGAKDKEDRGADGTLRLGARGESVTALQTDLAALGYTDSKGLPLQTDGHFGPGTKAAVTAFQSDNQLTADGTAGPKTLEAIHERRQAQLAMPEFTAPTLPNLSPSFDLRLSANDLIAPTGPVPTVAAQPRDPRDPGHPDHAMNQSVRDQVRSLYAGQGVSLNDQQLDRTTAAVMADARRSGLNEVTALRFTEDYATGKPNPNGNIFSFQGDPARAGANWSQTNTQQAAATPPEASYQQFAQYTQDLNRLNAQFQTQQTRTGTPEQLTGTGPDGQNMNGPNMGR